MLSVGMTTAFVLVSMIAVLGFSHTAAAARLMVSTVTQLSVCLSVTLCYHIKTRDDKIIIITLNA